MSDPLHSILDSATTRHSKEGGEKEFLSSLAEQVFQSLTLRSLKLWLRQDQHVAVLIQIGELSEQDANAESLRLAGTGRVRLSQCNDHRRLMVGSEIAPEICLTLDVVEGSDNVDEGLLVQLADVFADLQRRRMLEQRIQSSGREQMLAVLETKLHSTLDESYIANTLASDAVAILSCNRVSVARRRGQNYWEVLATTGVANPNDRSDAVRKIRDLIQQRATSTTQENEPASSVKVRPLSPSGTWSTTQFAAVFEYPPDAAPVDVEEAMLERICQHATLAFQNCARYQKRSLLGQAGGLLRAIVRPHRLLAMLLLICLIAYFTLTYSELTIEVYGELIPVERSYVFAPESGTITGVFVDDGSHVDQDQKLCVVESEDLNYELQSITGELAAITSRLAAISALRTDPRHRNDAMLSSEQIELNEKALSLESQSKILKQRIGSLTLTAKIDGQVYGHRLQQMLTNRPVQRGQFLFEVANSNVDWQLDLHIPEEDARYVLDVLGSSDNRPVITYALETSPEISRTTALTAIASSTEIDGQGQLFTSATAALEGQDFSKERPGAGVVASIHCGQFRTGFVRLRKIIELIQRHAW